MMHIRSTLGANEYNDDGSGPGEDLDDGEAAQGDLDRKSRSRSRQQQPRQTNLAKSPAPANRTRSKDDRSRYNVAVAERSRQGLAHHLSQANLPLANQGGLCSIEEVVSNRHNSTQKLEQVARKAQLLKNPSQSRVADYAKNFASQSAQMRNTMSSFFQTSGFQKQMTQKLAYEWKNIYRALSNKDEENLGIAKVMDFQRACAKSNVDFDHKELVKLVQTYGLQGQAVDRTVESAVLAEMDINYKKISTSLGLHKESFNYFNQVHQNNRAQNMHKLRQFYQTIDGQHSFLGKQGR